jgi:4-amino-4-deoxy-L-arabinose transferase-like glycosyltransferase
LMLEGIPPYKLAYSMKFSGIYAAYALIMAVFGQTITGIHLGLLLVNSATVAVIFLLGRRLTDEIGGSVAAASYALLSVSPSVLGSAAHATHFVMLPVLAGTFLLLEPHSMKRVLASGALFGIGLLMKQPACLFVLFGAIYLFIRHLGAGLGMKQAALRNLLFITGAIVPLTIACLLLWHAGVFNKFWFWTLASFCCQRTGSDWTWLDTLDSGWRGSSRGSVGWANACEHNFSARFSVFLSLGVIAGILFSIPLLHLCAAGSFAPRRRCNQQVVGCSVQSNDSCSVHSPSSI